MTISTAIPAFDAIERPTKDALKSAASLGGRQMRYLVDTFYQMQELRKASNNQIGSMVRAAEAGKDMEPHETLDWLGVQLNTMERQLSRAFEQFALAHMPGRWLMSITGIGPVLAANFLARLSVHPWHCTNPVLLKKREKGAEPVFPCDPDEPCQDDCGYRTVHTAGGFWRFAGLDSTMEWKEGELRPWNAAVKVACWKFSDGLVKLKNNEGSFYSKLYVQRKDREMAKNERREFADQAALGAARVGKKTRAYSFYKDGLLPPGHIDMRARRYAVKIFLSHLHHVMYVDEFDRDPPRPFILEHGGHAHMIEIPNWPFE